VNRRQVMLPTSDKDKRLDIKWTSHLKSEEEQKKFREYVLSSVGVLKRLETILKEKEVSREVFTEEDYKNPSWAYMQADRNGYVRALKEVTALLKGVDQYDRQH
jgi:hypothetical protein